MEVVKAVSWGSIPGKGISARPNAKLNYAALRIISLTRVPIVRSCLLVNSLGAGFQKTGISTKSTSKPLNSSG